MITLIGYAVECNVELCMVVQRWVVWLVS